MNQSSISILICPAKSEIIKALIPTTLESYYMNINLTDCFRQNRQLIALTGVNQLNTAAYLDANFSPFPVLLQRQIYNLSECQYTFSSSATQSNARTTKTSEKCSSFHISSGLKYVFCLSNSFQRFQIMEN